MVEGEGSKAVFFLTRSGLGGKSFGEESFFLKKKN